LEAHPAQGSNILLIVLDDVGVDKISGYDAHPDAPWTPNIDGLIDAGIRFDQAYAYPVCSPTRAALLTGRYGTRTGIGKVVDVHGTEVALGLDEVTIPEMLELSPHDYRTAVTGKWHLTYFHDQASLHPLQQGFDYHAGPMANPSQSIQIVTENTDYSFWEKSINGELEFTETYLTTDTTDEAIGQMATMSEPWFLYVPYNAPHEPLHIPPSELTHSPFELGSQAGLYNAMLQSVDTEIGRLLESMPEDLRARTTVVLIGDNGTPEFAIEPPFDSSRHKGTLYEGGVRVPWVVTGPFVREGGQTVQAMVNVVDIFETVAEIAEVDTDRLSRETGRALDGESFLFHLMSPGLITGRLYSYSERFGPNGSAPYDVIQRSIRDRRWKYIHTQTGDAQLFELYELESGAWDEGPNLLLEDALSSEVSRAWLRLDEQLERTVARLSED
jgi:arylsulfatase A-like enzyme